MGRSTSMIEWAIESLQSQIELEVSLPSRERHFQGCPGKGYRTLHVFLHPFDATFLSRILTVLWVPHWVSLLSSIRGRDKIKRGDYRNPLSSLRCSRIIRCSKISSS